MISVFPVMLCRSGASTHPSDSVWSHKHRTPRNCQGTHLGTISARECHADLLNYEAFITSTLERTCVCNVALCMPESPYYGVDDQLELPGGHGEQGAKAGVRNGPQQVEELQPVLRVVLQARVGSLGPRSR